VVAEVSEFPRTDPATTTTDFSRMTDVKAARLVAEKDAGGTAILAFTWRVHFDRDVKRRALARVVNSKGGPKTAKRKRLSRPIPRLSFEDAPDSGRPVPVDVDYLMSALKADVMVLKQSCTGREG
jgi:hypothetical protein